MSEHDEVRCPECGRGWAEAEFLPAVLEGRSRVGDVVDIILAATCVLIVLWLGWWSGWLLGWWG